MNDKIILTDDFGIKTEFTITGQKTFDVKRTQDVQKILDRNRADQNDSSFRNGYTESGDMKHVARIPLIVFEQWAKKHGLTPAEMMGPKGTEVIRKELNDPDNSYLRTGMGRI
ncbi:MAG: hypothetical protein E6Q97_09305 [Desulfurellales bacterium]|nr:MAG: hypothetical protein E6Q97_09305 [Desulfurellales bacterium]